MCVCDNYMLIIFFIVLIFSLFTFRFCGRTSCNSIPDIFNENFWLKWCILIFRILKPKSVLCNRIHVLFRKFVHLKKKKSNSISNVVNIINKYRTQNCNEFSQELAKKLPIICLQTRIKSFDEHILHLLKFKVYKIC